MIIVLGFALSYAIVGGVLFVEHAQSKARGEEWSSDDGAACVLAFLFAPITLAAVVIIEPLAALHRALVQLEQRRIARRAEIAAAEREVERLLAGDRRTT